MTNVAGLTPDGLKVAKNIADNLPTARLWAPERLAGLFPGAKAFGKVAEVVSDSFTGGEDLVCVMAAGIVARTIAPFIRSKDRDPAVVVVDEKGRYAISLLSGHLGGANALARRVAVIIGGETVITTATDVNDLPAFDVLASQNGLVIENLAGVRHIHMALLNGETVNVVDERNILGNAVEQDGGTHLAPMDMQSALRSRNPAVYIGYAELNWPERWLILRQKSLIAGVGCNRGAGSEEIVRLIKDSFREENLCLMSLKTIASIDAKADEPGLLEAATILGVDTVWFSREALARIDAPHPSPTVKKHMGVASVCEAAALLAAQTDRLLISKRKTRNVSLAVAASSVL